MQQRFLSTKEYSLLTGISEATLRRNFNSGKIPNATKIGGRIKFVVPIDDNSLVTKEDEIVRAIEHISNGYIELLNILKNK